MVAWLLKCNISRLFFMNFNKNFLNEVERIFLVFKTDFLYHQNAHFILKGADWIIFKYTSLYFFFMSTKVNRSTKSDFFYKFQIIKKLITKKKNYSVRSLLLDHFYLLISLEGMSTFIRSWTSFINQIWDVHLYNV